MKRSILVVAILLAMAVSSTAFAQYDNVKVVREDSTQYSGVIKIMMYLPQGADPNDDNAWVRELKVYNNDPVPPYTNPGWGLAANQHIWNTIPGSTSNVRYPNTPYIIPTNATGGGGVVDYTVQGSDYAVAFFQGAVGANVIITPQITTAIIMNSMEYVLVWSRTGRVFAFTLDQSQTAAIQGIVASDLF